MSRPGLRHRDQLGHAFHRQRGVHCQQVRGGTDKTHRRKITNRVVRHVLDQTRIDRQRAAAHQQRVAISSGLGDNIRTDGTTRARTIVDHERLTKTR